MATSSEPKKSMLGNLKQYIKEFDPQSGGQENGSSAKNMHKAWKDWIENAEMCMDLEEIEEGKKLNVIKILGGQQLRQKLATLTTESATYQECKTKLGEYFEDKRSINAIRHEFFNLRQRKNETTKEYAERCKLVGKECEFENFDLEDAIILNVCQYTPNEKLRNEILVKEMNYEQTVKYGTSLESARKEATRMRRCIKEEEEEAYDIERIRRPGPYSKRRGQRKEETNECGRCGRKQPHTCRALEATCYKCAGKGHFAVKCKTKKVKQLQEEEKSEEETEEDTEEDPDEY